jgi:LysR family hydrogen peroxide-inducible transcriptional activator
MNPAPRPHSLAGLSLRDLEYAVAVGELRHFGQAAARCAVSQSGLSEQIRKLEDLLGVALFERAPRRVSPTARGEALLRQAQRVLAEARGLLEMAAAAAQPLTGPLHLGVIATLGPYYLPFLLQPARQAFPALALRVSEGQTGGLIADLHDGKLDIALLAMPLGDEGLYGEALFFEPFRLVCPLAHPLAALARPGLSDIDGDELILLAEGHCLRDQALALCQGAQNQPGRVGQRVRQATSVEMLWHMIAAGEGYSLLPLLAAQDRRTLESIVATRILGDADAGRTIGLCWRRTDPRGAEFRQFCDFLRAHMPPGVGPPGR